MTNTHTSSLEVDEELARVTVEVERSYCLRKQETQGSRWSSSSLSPKA